MRNNKMHPLAAPVRRLGQVRIARRDNQTRQKPAPPRINAAADGLTAIPRNPGSSMSALRIAGDIRQRRRQQQPSGHLVLQRPS